ncbi:MAG: PD40 domain-containing protein [Phycisphaerales bacterium]|nr:PD40 domain-containing protein [Phycisphaerales bacterium]
MLKTIAPRPLVLVALSGTMMTLPACAKRVGFWDRTKQHQTEQELHAQEQSQFQNQSQNQSQNQNQTRSSTYFTPGQAESGSSVQNVAQSTGNENQFQSAPELDSGSFASKSTRDGFQSGGTASITTSPTPETMVTDEPITSAAPEPYAPIPTPAAGSVAGGDLSAWIYSNAMGIELPTESTSPATRATVNIRKITDAYAGSDFDPIVSPDGGHLIYASTQHRPTADIYTKSIRGAVVTRLTDDPGQDVMPSISPDGSTIAFASDRNGSWDIFLMPAEGGNKIQITNESAHDLHPSWSPDGTKLVFSRLGQQTGRWEMWVTDVASDHGAQFIGFGLFPEWCPVGGTGVDGADKILFQRSRERGDRAFSVWTIDFTPNPGTAGRETEIASGADQALINPTWSPDGQFVCFAAVPYSQAWVNSTTARPDMSTIWMVSINGTNKVKLTDGTSVDLMPAWGRNNNIFFVSNMDGQDHLWSMELSPAVRAASLRNPEFESTFANVPTDNPTVGE